MNQRRNKYLFTPAKERAYSTTTTAMLYTLNRDVIAKQKMQIRHLAALNGEPCRAAKTKF